MFIKSIILDGFKSYGQRTEIAGFDDQFNAITGLNGSGKSNILDSICFLLGITNLTHVRATSLQDLIYRSGQAGINKATVSITFDNTNPSQCPPGFETYKEITITRQIVMGGKNKYMINGTNVPNKKVQDLFCSIQLNVNNPHFLIMQGKITKVLNMKPPEILAMVEEAAGTRMYEVKRQFCQKTIEKKEAKLLELTAVAKDEISPKLEKLREERSQYLEYQRVERELEHMLELYHVWQYFDAKRLLSQAEKSLQEGSTKTKSLEDNITKNKVTIKELEDDVEEITKNNKTEASEKLNSIEVELKEQGKLEAKATALAQSVKDNISAEVKQKKQFEKNVIDDTKVLQLKEEELNNVQSLFETLKINDVNDNEALLLAQRKFEALSAGMEVNEDGEAETLQEQLINAKQEASQADTESKQALMQLKFCQSQLEEKQKDLVNTSDIQKDTVEMENLEKQVRQLDSNIRNINYSEERMNELLEKRRTLQYEIRGLREKVERFEAQRPYAKFSYRDPESNFNRSKVHGVVGRLINCKDNSACTAIETAAGGRLYDVVVDNDVTSKKLLKHGNLQQRTTFIPLNKIQSHRMDENIIRYAQELVGKENCQSALSLLNYEKNLQPAMDFIFGNVFICKDLNIARQVTFNDRIRRRCVTLDGDVTDPAGVLSGGARKKGGSVLLQIQEIKDIENTLRINEKELQNIERELNALSSVQENYTSLMRQLDVKKHELQLVKQRVQNTAHHRQQEEVNNLKVQISELTQKVKHCKDIVAKCNQKAKELETKMKDSKGYREKQLKEAEKEMAKLKKQAENSRKEWKQREQDYETLKLEISELKKGIENTKAQIKKSEETQVELEEKHQELLQNASELTEKVSNLRTKVKEMKTAIAHKNKEIQEKINKKEKLIAQNTEYELQIQQYAHDIKKLQDDVRNAKTKEQELSKRIKDDGYLDKAKDMSHKDGLDLERRIRSAQEKKQKLSRTVNAKAQSMFEHEEKQFLELRKKQRIVENDRNKMISVLNDLDQKKKNSLKLAFEQVSKDFGSIFGTLLPGANARLAAPLGKTILEGIEIKVSLGGVWKDSLTELSGGQRSLAALSLILAMLLFKPAPLYILDEVDAALDLSHTQNIGNMLKSHFKKSQFIIVSLKDGMFNNANVLFKTKFVDGVSTVGRTVNKRH